MYKVHKQYYRRAYEIEETEKDKEDSFNKHYEKGQEQRNTEAKLDKLISEFFQIAAEYFVLNKNISTVQTEFDKVYEFTYPKSRKFFECNTLEELYNKQPVEEKRLNLEFKKLLDSIKHIQNLMK